MGHRPGGPGPWGAPEKNRGPFQRERVGYGSQAEGLADGRRNEGQRAPALRRATGHGFPPKAHPRLLVLPRFRTGMGRLRFPGSSPRPGARLTPRVWRLLCPGNWAPGAFGSCGGGQEGIFPWARPPDIARPMPIVNGGSVALGLFRPAFWGRGRGQRGPPETREFNFPLWEPFSTGPGQRRPAAPGRPQTRFVRPAPFGPAGLPRGRPCPSAPPRNGESCPSARESGHIDSRRPWGVFSIQVPPKVIRIPRIGQPSRQTSIGPSIPLKPGRKRGFRNHAEYMWAISGARFFRRLVRFPGCLRPAEPSADTPGGKRVSSSPQAEPPKTSSQPDGFENEMERPPRNYVAAGAIPRGVRFYATTLP